MLGGEASEETAGRCKQHGEEFEKNAHFMETRAVVTTMIVE